jgi:hypothetical protein
MVVVPESDAVGRAFTDIVITLLVEGSGAAQLKELFISTDT